MRVGVFGLGYVGCVTSACLARAGHDIVGVDVNREKVEMLNAGLAPVIEPGLAELVAEMVAIGRLRATDSVEDAVARTDLGLICVGTPGRANGQLDTDAIERVGREVGRALAACHEAYPVVLRSTVLPGTTEAVLAPAIARGAGREPGPWLRVAVNPEFMREGSSLRDFDHPPFTLIGCDDVDTPALLGSVYSRVDAPFVRTSIRTAEMVKYVSNAFHALKVCFANEIGDLCAALGADAQKVMRVFLMDKKLNVSEAYLRPGFAFGGSCLPKDLRALLHAGRGGDLAMPVLSAILPSNEMQVRRAVEAVIETRRRRVGVVGLAFKSGTDDLRESPMVALVETLIGKGYDVRILDRSVTIASLVGANRRYIEHEIPHISALMCEDPKALLDHAEVLVVGNAGEEAARVLAGARADHVVIDLTRGLVRERHAPGGA
jgi:GDP-mannose 6-dehydrogenase